MKRDRERFLLPREGDIIPRENIRYQVWEKTKKWDEGWLVGVIRVVTPPSFARVDFESNAA